MTVRPPAAVLSALALALASAASAATLDDVRAALRQGNDAAAERAAREILAGAPTAYEAAWAGFLLGRSLERQNRPAEAREAYLGVPAADPSSTLVDDALFFAARLLEADSPAGAVALYRRAALHDGDYRRRAEAAIARLVPIPPARSPTATATAGETPPPATGAPAPRRPAPPGVTIQFQDAEIRQFIRWVSEATGRNFVIADNVTGNVTIYAGREIPVEEIYPAFLAVLEVKGFAAVEGAGVTKIVARAEAARAEGPIYLGPIPDLPPDRVVTRIFRLRHVDAGTLSGILRPLIAPSDVLLVHQASNALVMTGPVANIGRMAEAIEALDVAGPVLSLEVLRLEYAPAEAAAATVREVLAGLVPPGGAPSRTKILPDARTNALVVLGDEEDRRVVRDLVARIDADEARRRAPRAIRLRYAEANDIAAKAREIFALDGSAGRGRVVADARTNTLYVSGAPEAVLEALEAFVADADTTGGGAGAVLHVYPLQNTKAEDLAPVLSQLFSGAAAVQTVAIGRGTTEAAPAGGAPGGEAAAGPVGPVRIVAEPQQNALLVLATPVDYARVRPVIASLDVRKRQVVVDALILEASIEKIRELGVELNTLDPPLPFHTRPIGGTNFGVRPAVISGQAEGLVGGIFRGSLVGPTIQALAKSADVNVVSSPQVIAEENREAEIFVGDLIPVITSQVTTTIEVGAGQPGILQSVDYRNVGVRLKMKPQINDDGFITMEIQVQVEGIREAAVPQSALRLPAFTSRLVTTRSQVRDGDYVVLGGLISEQADRTIQKVPILGDIPLFGLLFRRQSVRRDKTNLIVFLRPRIVTDPDYLLRITEEERGKYSEGARPTGRRPDYNDLDRIIPEE